MTDLASAKAGPAVIKVDGAEVASGQAAAHAALPLEASETFDIGSDTGTGVDDADYMSPFPFTGKLKLTIKLGTNG